MGEKIPVRIDNQGQCFAMYRNLHMLTTNFKRVLNSPIPLTENDLNNLQRMHEIAEAIYKFEKGEK